MNGWGEIVRLLVENPGLRELVIAPHAPPVSPRAEGRRILLGGRVFSDADVADTLASAAAHSSGRRPGDLGQAGVLSLGVRDAGRIRISYLTQRGSRVMRIVRVPFEVPTIDTVCMDPPLARELVEAIGARRYRLILVYGPTQMVNSQLNYALLAELNRTHREVIFIAERMLSFLMAHDNSVVIQVEIPTDAPSLEAAMQQALLLEPEAAHFGNISVTDDLPSLPQLINANTCTILSTVGENASLLLDRLPASLHRRVSGQDAGMLLSVQPADDGRVKLEMQPWPRLKAAE